MNRLPLRPSRIQLPLRGRLATVLSPEQKQKYSEPVIPKRPSLPKSVKSHSVPAVKRQTGRINPSGSPTEQPLGLRVTVGENYQDRIGDDSRPNLVKPDEQQFVTSETFGQLKLWQWLLGLILLIILSMFIGNLF